MKKPKRGPIVKTDWVVESQTKRPDGSPSLNYRSSVEGCAKEIARLFPQFKPVIFKRTWRKVDL